VIRLWKECYGKSVPRASAALIVRRPGPGSSGRGPGDAGYS
jgi:hypothetical protein